MLNKEMPRTLEAATDQNEDSKLDTKSPIHHDDGSGPGNSPPIIKVGLRITRELNFSWRSVSDGVKVCSS